MFILQVCLDLILLLVAYLFMDKFMIPKVIRPLGLLVTAFVSKREDRKYKDEDYVEDDMIVSKDIHQFNKGFYSLAVVTPTVLSPFTSSPGLVDMYLDNCETLRDKISDSFNTPSPSVVHISSPKSTGDCDSLECIPSASDFIAKSRFSMDRFLSSPVDIEKYLDDGEEDQLDMENEGSPFVTPRSKKHIEDTKDEMDLEDMRTGVAVSEVLKVDTQPDSQDFLTSYDDILNYLDYNEDERHDNYLKELQVLLPNKRDSLAPSTTTGRGSQPAFLATSPEVIDKLMDDIEEDRLGHIRKRNITTFMKPPPRRILRLRVE